MSNSVESKPTHHAHEAPPPMAGLPLALATIALSLAVFMQVLDSTIANVALPTIAGDLGAATAQSTWVITMFAMANAISIPLTGFLSKFFGQVRVFLWSASLFVLCSWLCGISTSLEELIIFRVMQGAVAGPMIPLAQSLLMQCFPAHKRAMALGLYAMVVVTAPILGPISGGYICDNFSWRWIFFINIPIGFIAILVAWRQLQGRETAKISSKIDFVGLVFLIFGVGSLQLMLDRGRELDWFNSTQIVVLAVISIVCLTALVIWEWDTKNPIINLRLFLDRNFTVGTIAVSAAFMVYMGALVLLPLVLQTNLGYTAIWAGLATSPVGIFPIILMPLIGRYAHKLDMRLLVTISFLIYGGTFYWRSNFMLQMSYWDVFWPQFIQGLGTALFLMPLTQIILSRVPVTELAAATGLSNFLRNMFGGIGASVVTSHWQTYAANNHAYLTEHITPYASVPQQYLHQLTSMGMQKQQAYEFLNGQISLQSSIIGSNQIFYISAIFFVCLTVIVWFAKPPFVKH